MKIKGPFMALCIMLTCHVAQATERFSIQSVGGVTSELAIDEIFTETSVLTPFVAETPITGLSITGKVDVLDDDYLVRVVLTTVDHHEYCVLESYCIKHEQSFTFSGYCEETALLEGTVPDSLKLVVRGARLELNTITLQMPPYPGGSAKAVQHATRRQILQEQEDATIAAINCYNQSHGKLWVAGQTPYSGKSYEEKKRLLGFDDSTSTYGFEYYSSGIFEAGNPISTVAAAAPSQYKCVESFDWRNRHGKNWLNSVKHQGNSYYCLAFAAAGTMEARMNLYYNQLLGLDLSAQNIAKCAEPANMNSYTDGMYYSDVLNYVCNQGVCDAASYPFVDDSTETCHIDEIDYQELVTVNNYSYISNYREDVIKRTLAIDGPLLSGFTGHSMVLAGYGVIHAGDSIRIKFSDGSATSHICIPEGSNYIGKTYWIFKNSYGTDAGITTDGGYAYIMFYDMSYMRGPYRLNYPYSTLTYTDEDIVCEDADGDGYYFWGLGAKPASCPDWVPDVADGDDSDETKGMMMTGDNDVIGTLEDLSAPGSTVISVNFVYVNRSSSSNNIVVSSGATLTVQSVLNMIGRVRITVKPGAHLIVDGGVITNAEILLGPGSLLTLKNGGKLIMRTNTSFTAPAGAVVDISEGKILHSHDF